MSPDTTTPKLDVRAMSDAIQHQAFVRNVAFLPASVAMERIAGYEVLPMTPTHWLTLKIADSPILVNRSATPFELAQFLWVLNPKFGNANAHKKFMVRCLEFIPGREPAGGSKKKPGAPMIDRVARAIEIEAACHAFVFESLADRPAGRKGGGSQEDFYSDACWFCAVLGREYGYSRDFVMSMPIKQVFQFINEARLFHDPQAAVRSVSAEYKGKWLDELAEQDIRDRAEKAAKAAKEPDKS